MAHNYPTTWYWQVDDSTPATTRWQASSGSFVATSNADYLAFLAEGNSPSEIDTFVNLCQVIDSYNYSLQPAGYLAVSSGVNYQMLNTPPLLFDFTPTAGGLTLTLPQVNLFGSLAKGRLLIVRNGSSTIPFTISRFGALTLNPGVVPVNGFVVLQLSDNSTQGGVFRPAFWLQARYETHGNANDTLVAAAAAVVVYANNAAFSAPRTWTLPAANTFIPGQLILVVDEHGGVSATNTLSVARAGSDTINGAATSVVLNRAFDFTLLQTDGVSQFTTVGGKGALSSSDLSDTLTSHAVLLGAGGSTAIAFATIGTAGRYLRDNGAGADPSMTAISAADLPGIQAKVGSFTRDTSVATGTQAVTGVGFTPKAVVFVAGSTGGTSDASAGGLDDGTSSNVLFLIGGVYAVATGSSIAFNQGGGNIYTGHIQSLDADGFTISWTKTGTPTGTRTIGYLAIR